MITYDTVWKNLSPCTPLNSRIFQIVTFMGGGGEKSVCVPLTFVRNVTCGWLNLSVTCVLFPCSCSSEPSVLRSSFFQACDTCCRKCQRLNRVWYFVWNQTTFTCLQYVNKHILGRAEQKKREKKTKRRESLSSIVLFLKRVMRGNVSLSVSLNTYLLSASGKGFFCFHFFFGGEGVFFFSRLKQQSVLKRATAAAQWSSLKEHIKQWNSRSYWSHGARTGCTRAYVRERASLWNR